MSLQSTIMHTSGKKKIRLEGSETRPAGISKHLRRGRPSMPIDGSETEPDEIV